MSSVKLRNSILAARDGRQELLDRQLACGCPATLFLSLNIPGSDKLPPGTEALFAWALTSLKVLFPGLITLTRDIDYLGPHALLALHQEALPVKQQCINLETSHPAARLIDLDVYDQRGNQISRATLSLPPAPVCSAFNRPWSASASAGTARMKLSPGRCSSWHVSHPESPLLPALPSNIQISTASPHSPLTSKRHGYRVQLNWPLLRLSKHSIYATVG